MGLIDNEDIDIQKSNEASDNQEQKKESVVKEVKLPQKKNLIPRETIIKIAHTQVDGKNIEIKIRYGNIVTPAINGKFQNLPDAKYKLMLDDFLCSDEGLLFNHPTEQAIDRVSAETKNYIKEKNKFAEANQQKEVPPNKVQENNKQAPNKQTSDQSQQGEQPQQQSKPQASPKPKEETPKKEEPKKEEPEVKAPQAADVMSTTSQVYLEAVREQSLISQEALLIEKAEQLKKAREQKEKIQSLEKELAKQKKKDNSTIEKLTSKLLEKNEEKDISFDRLLLQLTSVCLIISSCLIGIMIFLIAITR